MTNSERGDAGVPFPSDGLSAAELAALSTEGELQPRRTSMAMDWIMKLMMGGWIPAGKRTQWLACAVFLTTVVNGLIAWGTGDQGVVVFMQTMKEQWEAVALALGLYYVGEKVDNK
jgi:hypothetical protein